jgi:hypothetical protein
LRAADGLEHATHPDESGRLRDGDQLDAIFALKPYQAGDEVDQETRLL